MMNKYLFSFLTLLLIAFNVIAQKSNDVLKYEMDTRWTKEVNPDNVWQQYPRPQMTRADNWSNLNGLWQYAIEDKTSERPESFDGEILVPFPVESTLSRVKKLVGDNNYLWYKRRFKVLDLKEDERLLMHFGAVDWEAVIFINGKKAGSHKGGYDPFTVDISDFLEEGEQEVVVRVWDPTDNGTQPRGKQVNDPKGIWYTPVTGIWQTVWLETVPDNYIKNIKITPDIDRHEARLSLEFSSLDANSVIEAKVLDEKSTIPSKSISIGKESEQAEFTLDIPNPILWSPDNPHLYDLEVTVKSKEGEVIDKIGSYLGMRKISLGKDPNGHTRIMLNNKPNFQFGLLDQGWWPDGLYTPPTEEAMVYDIKVTKELGFNMLRKHVKVENARFYYHCDKMGMLVWQDMPNGNYFRDLRIQAWEEQDADRPLESAIQFEYELKEMIDDFHVFPSIVVWVPFNEGWGQYETERVSNWVKNYDPSRLCDATSGWADRSVGDMIDGHLYPGPGMEPTEPNRASVLGEFGGLGWPVNDHLWWDKRNWGYLTYEDKATFEKEFDNLIKSLYGLKGWGLSAAIYTQTSDVEGEVNGVMTYDREVVKLDPKKTKSLIQPLYQSWWSKRKLVGDSEQNNFAWKVSFKQPKGNWVSPHYSDIKWEKHYAPFSSEENPFLPKSTTWDGKELFARTTFHLNEIPTTLFLKHYMPKTELKLYINGQLVKELKDGGGRKRHYTHIILTNAIEHLKKGKNVIAVEVLNPEKKGAFDIGLYTTEKVNGEKLEFSQLINGEN